jgi:hypothetical protein
VETPEIWEMLVQLGPAAFDATVGRVFGFAATRKPESLRLASSRTSGHAATAAENRKTNVFLKQEADVNGHLAREGAGRWNRPFPFRHFSLDKYGAYAHAATSIVKQLARKRSDHFLVTVVLWKCIAYPAVSRALGTANARMLPLRRTIVSSLSLATQCPGTANPIWMNQCET